MRGCSVRREMFLSLHGCAAASSHPYFYPGEVDGRRKKEAMGREPASGDVPEWLEFQMRRAEEMADSDAVPPIPLSLRSPMDFCV